VHCIVVSMGLYALLSMSSDVVVCRCRRVLLCLPCVLRCCSPAGQSVVNVYMNKDKNFAFIEFRTGRGRQRGGRGAGRHVGYARLLG
jgi:hypothetical protein